MMQTCQKGKICTYNQRKTKKNMCLFSGIYSKKELGLYNGLKARAAVVLLLLPAFDSSRQAVYVLFQNRCRQSSHPSQQTYGKMKQERHPSYINPTQLDHLLTVYRPQLVVFIMYFTYVSLWFNIVSHLSIL